MYYFVFLEMMNFHKLALEQQDDLGPLLFAIHLTRMLGSMGIHTLMINTNGIRHYDRLESAVVSQK